MFEGLTCVYRSNVDLFFYVIGSSAENEVSASLKHVLMFPFYSHFVSKDIFNGTTLPGHKRNREVEIRLYCIRLILITAF